MPILFNLELRATPPGTFIFRTTPLPSKYCSQGFTPSAETTDISFCYNYSTLPLSYIRTRMNMPLIRCTPLTYIATQSFRQTTTLISYWKEERKNLPHNGNTNCQRCLYLWTYMQEKTWREMSAGLNGKKLRMKSDYNCHGVQSLGS
jgi:hypothetical protein